MICQTLRSNVYVQLIFIHFYLEITQSGNPFMVDEQEGKIEPLDKYLKKNKPEGNSKQTAIKEIVN